MTIDVEALYTAARELTTDLLPRLQALIPDKGTPLESRIGSHGKALAAPLPWNEPVAMLYYEIHGDARRYESLLTIRLFGHAKYRPGTDAHTTAVINRLPVLIAHGIDKNLDPLDLTDPARALTAWPKQIRALLDEPKPGEEKWANAPGGLVCPHCTRPLAVPPGWKYATDITLTCRRCTDDAGTHHTWAPDEWLGKLEDEADHDPERLITAETCKRLFPHIRRNNFDVWAFRATETPHSAPIPSRGTNRNGKVLFRLGDVEGHIATRTA